MPTEAHEVRGVWFESFNEQSHFRDLLLTRAVTQMSTQPMELAWNFEPEMRRHIPDCLCRLVHGSSLLRRCHHGIEAPGPSEPGDIPAHRHYRRVAGLALRTATELPAQRQHNGSFIWACRIARPEDTQAWILRLRGLTWPHTVHSLAMVMGADTANVGGVWHLAAIRRVGLDLNAEIEPDTAVTRAPRPEGSPAWVVAL